MREEFNMGLTQIIIDDGLYRKMIIQHFSIQICLRIEVKLVKP